MIRWPPRNHQWFWPAHDELAKGIVQPIEFKRIVEKRTFGARGKIMQQIGNIIIIDNIAGHDAGSARDKPAKSAQPRVAVGLGSEAQHMRLLPEAAAILHPRIDKVVAGRGEVGNRAAAIPNVAGIEAVAIGQNAFRHEAAFAQKFSKDHGNASSLTGVRQP